jgi:glutamine synthetase type III
MYLGDDLTTYLDNYVKGDTKPYVSIPKMLDMGASALAPIEVPSEDRNRTSPFPYGGIYLYMYTFVYYVYKLYVYIYTYT